MTEPRLRAIVPAVRDLLVAIDTALNAAELRDYSVCAVQTAIRSAVLYGDLEIDWLIEGPGETADARRVRRADTWDLYQTTKELPA